MNMNKEKHNVICHVITNTAEEFYWCNNNSITKFSSFDELLAADNDTENSIDLDIVDRVIRSENAFNTFEKDDDWYNEVANYLQHDSSAISESFDILDCVGIWVR